jgi:hypothetical protein
MAMSHADHDHPNTPGARAACRRRMILAGSPAEPAAGVVKPAQMTVVPRKRGDGGVVRGLKATEPQASNRRLKVSGWQLKSIGDLADVPATLAAPIREAWKRGWVVQVGDRFNEAERRIVITAPGGEVSLVWSEDGRTGVFFRPGNSSVTSRKDGWARAFELAEAAEGM